MEKEKLYCGDSFSAKDGIAKPVGVVALVGEDGSILFKGHNMIVETGRQMILKRLFKDEGLPSFRFMFDTKNGNVTTPSTVMPETSRLTDPINVTEDAPYKEYPFSYSATGGITMSDTISTQSADNEYSVINSDGMTLKAFAKGDAAKTVSSLAVGTTIAESGYIREEKIESYAYLNVNGIRMDMKGTITVADPNPTVTIFAVGLAFGGGTTTDPYVLFSRCVTDKIKVNLNRTLRVYYTLYF